MNNIKNFFSLILLTTFSILAMEKPDYKQGLDHEIIKASNNLMQAIKQNQSKKVIKFIKQGACINNKPINSPYYYLKRVYTIRTPLILAAKLNNLKIAKILIKNGANVDEYLGLNTPLLSAINSKSKKMVEYLIAAGANVHKTTPASPTPIMCASMENQKDIIKLLVISGANINDIKRTLIDKQTKREWLQFAKKIRLEMLIQKLTDAIQNKESKKVISLSSEDNVGKELLNTKIGDNQNTLLHEAILNCSKKTSPNDKIIIRSLLAANKNLIVTQNSRGFTPLEYAIALDKFDIVEFLAKFI